MSFEQFLKEAPLPDDWDKETFSPKMSFKKQLDYALDRAKKIGTGSARVAFEIEYKGRPTILKVAKNAKGLSQNEEEVRILDDYMVPGIVIPIIDYDEENEPPRWIHMEKAEKVKSEKQLCKLLKVPDLRALTTASSLNNKVSFYGTRESKIEAIKDYNKGDEDSLETALSYVDQLTELEQTFDVNLADFNRTANWGIYKGEPVVIDLGFSGSVVSLYK